MVERFPARALRPFARAAEDSDGTVMRGATAGWFLITGLLLSLTPPGSPAGRPWWAVPLVLFFLALCSLATPLERLPKRAQMACPYVAIVMVLGLIVGYGSGGAAATSIVVVLPLVWLALRHGGRALAWGICLAAAECGVSVVIVQQGDDLQRAAYVVLATLVAIVVALVARVRGRQTVDAARLASVAYTDFLTNCPNRRAWDDALPRRLEAAGRQGLPLAVAVLDLDNFSIFNEDWGHAAGDRLLTDTATALRFAQRDDPDQPGLSYIARVGADEFAIVLEGLSTGRAAARVRELENDLPHGCTISAGIALWDRRETAEDLMNRVLRALDVAGRSAGHARVVVDEGAGARAGSWLDSVPTIVARGEIESVYQPIRGLAQNDLFGFEALARPSLAPADTEVDGMFVAARRLGITRELEALCQRAAMDGAHLLLAPGGLLFINVSVGALVDPDRDLDAMVHQLSEAILRPDQIVLEVNEQITRLGRFADACALFRSAGFRFAMDDVGEGLSTIEALAAVRPEFIKIAKSLVQTADDVGSAAVIRGLIEIARSLGGKVIAEGVQTAEDCVRMRDLGATLGQGWALGRPARLRDVLIAA
ncbi:MAG: bifunctional diguanylate cyclase/phosphodiesterase [Candidatus Dormibacteria bacterium]|jgi:diguanylate cyclase (GGDEF)-like protein